MDKVRKALLYCRVSGKKQTKDGSGLSSQEHRCRQYAEAKGYKVEEVFPDDVSGGGDFMLRKGMVALLAYMDARPHENFVVIFDDLKRYSRDVEFHMRLRRIMQERGAIRECLNFNFEESPEGKFKEVISVAASELEREQMGRQNKQKSIARVEQGFCVRSVPPIGLKYKKAEGGGKVLVHDEPLASIIREALEGYASGRFQGQAEVKRFLEAQPEFPKNFPDGTIRQQRVRNMLEQILYAGYIAAPAWGISMREAKHEGIISKETYWRIQERLKGRPAMPARKDADADFPLRGAVACSSCGYALTGGWSRGKYKHYAYYRCHHHGCPEKGKGVPVARLEESVDTVLKSLRPSMPYAAMIKAMFAKAWSTQTKRLEQVAKSYANRVHEIEREIGKTLDRMLEVSSPRALNAFEQRLDALEQEKLIAAEKAAAKPAKPGKFEELFELSMGFLTNPYKVWKNGDPDARKLVLRLAFDGPLAYTRETACLNSEKSSVFKLLEDTCMPDCKMVLQERIELSTSPLPRECSTPELLQPGAVLAAGCRVGQTGPRLRTARCMP